MSIFGSLTHQQQIDELHKVATSALTHWDGDFVDLALIKYRENAVFRTTRADGTKAVLRIHRDGYHSKDALLSEFNWMQELAAGGVGVPLVIRSRNDQPLVEAGHDTLAGLRYVDMLGWVNGTSFGSAEGGMDAEGDMTQVFYKAGEAAARIHLHSCAWDQPNEFTRHAWDEEGLIGHSPFWGRFWELATLTEEQRELLQRCRRLARADLREYGRSRENFGMIHADLVPENLLFDGPQLNLIDFDDAGFGWYMFELATALYFSVGDERYAEIEASLLRGYQSVRALSQADLDRLPLFLMLRSFTYLGWIHTREGSSVAEELGPMLIERCCAVAQAYLSRR